MVILGASGHALEIMDVLLYNNPGEVVCFFDNVSSVVKNDLIKRHTVIKTEDKLAEYFLKNKEFVLGVGNTSLRKKMADLATSAGGNMVSVIAKTAYVSKLNVALGIGLNIMHNAVIHPNVYIGDCTLINCAAIVHHETKVGSFCEICPRAIITGNVQIGDYTMIGSGAIILPGLKIGSNVKVGAGAVVTKDISSGVMVTGVPAIVKE